MTEPAPQEPRHGEALAAIVRGMAVALLGSIVGGGLGFVFVVVMGRTLSRSDFGLFVVTLNVVTTVSTLSVVGADLATIRFVAATADPGRKRGAMLTPLALVGALNFVLAAAIAVFARPLAVHVLGRDELTEPLRAVAVVLPLTVLAVMFSAAVSGLEQARGELIRKVAEQGGRIVCSPLAIALGFGLAGAVLGMAVAGALAAGAVGVVLLRSLPRGGRTQVVPVRDVVAFAWPQTIANAASSLWWVATSVILLRLSGNGAAAAFGAAAAIARLPALIYNSFTFRFAPTISRLWEARQLDELHDLLRGVTRWVAMFAVPFYAIAIALPGPLLHVFGSSYRYGRAPVALATVAAAVMIDSLAGPVDRALIMTGRVRMEMAANVCTATAMLGVTYLLIDAFGLVGAALALVAYNVVVNALKAILVWRTLRMTPLSFAVAGPLAAGAVAGGVTAVVGRVTGLGGSLPGTALLALLLLVVYGALLLQVVGVSRGDRAALSLALRPGR